MPLLHWAMPSKYRSIHKNDLARAMVAQSEQAFLGDGFGRATVKILEYEEMAPFFLRGRARRVKSGSLLGGLVLLGRSLPAKPIAKRH